MGIESDKVVYEYLSRVGDVAQQRQLPSGARMRLVSELRNEIDRRRAGATADSPAAVRRIISRLGTPDEVVRAAGGADGTGAVPVAPTHVPVQRDDEPGEGERRKGLGAFGRVVPRPRTARSGGPADLTKSTDATDRTGSGRPAPPHLAGPDELGDGAAPPDWWRVGGTRLEDDNLPPGFIGGVEIPGLLKPPPRPRQAPDAVTAPPAAGKGAEAVETGENAEGEEPGGVTAAPAPRRRLLPRPRGAGRWSNPLLLLAAALLVAGAVLGNWFALLLGWVIAYASRRLTQNESKWAVMGMPGIAVAAGIAWLWGRQNGRWGDPIAQGHMNDAISQTWPWVVRGAAVLSALFVAWRSQRRP
ncbi:hypothetical protein ABZT17_18455 [Streptomyces sp. NPDC005648]|uniref:hypothetical protein n=1 Tax=Streptomyces sp. NPDC005648 TaxID=3157044 RepID=UPI0033BB1FD6